MMVCKNFHRSQCVFSRLNVLYRFWSHAVNLVLCVAAIVPPSWELLPAGCRTFRGTISRATSSGDTIAIVYESVPPLFSSLVAVDLKVRLRSL